MDRTYISRSDIGRMLGLKPSAVAALCATPGFPPPLVVNARVYRALDTGQFTAKALMLHLRPQDYGRPLSEIRDAFYNAPRLPLLYGGDKDLQQAIYDAVQDGTLRITSADGTEVAVTAPTQVNLGATELRLAPPVDVPPPTDSATSSGTGIDAAAPGVTAIPQQPGLMPIDQPGQPVEQSAIEKYLAFTLVGNLLDADKSTVTANLFLALYKALDEHKASYAQGTLQLVLDAETAEKVAEIAQSLGINVQMRDQ